MKTFTTVAAALALTAGLAFAAPQGDGERGHMGKKKGHMGAGDHAGHMGKGDHGKMMGRMAEKLDLSEGQKIQMQQLHESFRAQNAPFRESMQATKTQLREARQSGDTARAQQLAAELEGQRTQMLTQRQAMHEQMLTILTPDQKTKLEAMKAEKNNRKGERKQRGTRQGGAHQH
jgi:periplasmic protein CpxP/Spy